MRRSQAVIFNPQEFDMKASRKPPPTFKSDDQIPYVVDPLNSPAEPGTEEELIASALAVLGTRLKRGHALRSPKDVKDYLCLRGESHGNVEVFSVLFLDAHNNVISHDAMFFGTLTQTSVYPREVVRSALAHAAAGVILSHNHPSGNATPSRADEMLTQTLKAALALIDVKVLDHIIVAGADSYSLAEHGLL